MEPYIASFEFSIAEVSIIELLGVKEIDKFVLKQREAIINECVVPHYNSFIRETAIKLKQKYTIKIPDALVAASSIHYDIPLLTADKDFRKIDELEVVIINL